MTVTVAMPFYGPADLLEKAVRSILGQTYRDLHLFVIGDGVEPRLPIGDSRLEVYSYPKNRGPYFALQLALLASPHAWFSPHGADDWSEPERLEQLVALARPGIEAVTTGAIRVHVGRGDVDGFVHPFAFEVGLYKRDRLLSFGGYNPAERIGQDTLMLRLVRLTGPDSVVTYHQPTYNRLKHPGTLTTSPKTGHGSVARREMRARNRVIFARCEALGRASLIRDYRASVVPPSIALELAEHVQRLSRRVGAVAA